MKRILIVEDEAVTALHLKQELTDLGYEVVGTVDNAADAVRLATAATAPRPDLVLMDIQLAGAGDGVSAASIIRPAADVPVVFLTAHGDEATLQRALDASPFGYILKPLQVRELSVNIELALYKHGKEKEMRRLVKELELALAKVNVLSGLLPICTSCKRIRDATGTWRQLEAYITTHSEAEFSHTYCPACEEIEQQRLEEAAAGNG